MKEREGIRLPLRYRCLFLDHDDTTVDSTPTVHYPAFCRSLEELRPDVHLSLDEFVRLSCDPGFGALCEEVLRFTPDEMQRQ